MKTMNDIRAMLQTNPMLQIPADIQENIPLIEQGFDSLDMIMLLHAVKEHFSVGISQEEIPGLRSLQDIINLLNTNRIE